MNKTSMFVSAYVAIVVPESRYHDEAVNAAVAEATKIAGGCSETSQIGSWYDDEGNLYHENVARFQWNFDPITLPVSFDSAIDKVVDTLLDAGELAVFKEMILPSGRYCAEIVSRA